MTHEIQSSDLKEILAALRENGDLRRKWIANQLECVDVAERLKGYDPPVEFRQYISDLCGYLQSNFNLDEWSFNLQFVSISPDQEDTELGEEIKASIHVNQVYLFFGIKVSPVVLAEWRDAQFERIGFELCHEFCHVLMHPVGRLALTEATASQKWLFNETIERQTQRFSVVVANSLPDDWFTPAALESWLLKHPTRVHKVAPDAPAAAN